MGVASESADLTLTRPPPTGDCRAGAACATVALRSPTDDPMLSTDMPEHSVTQWPKPYRALLRVVLLAVAPALSAAAAAADCGAPGKNVDWTGCTKQMLMLSGTDFGKSTFDRAILTATDFSGAQFAGSTFVRCEVTRTSFRNADLSGANLEKCSGHRTVFDGARMENAILQKAEFNRSSFMRAKLKGADLSKADFGRAAFDGADLTGVNFWLANLSRARFPGAQLSGADFREAYTYRTDFSGADLSSVTHLTQKQIDLACGDAKTALPPGLSRPADWVCED